MSLNADYLDQHSAVHTPDSFARAIIELAIRNAHSATDAASGSFTAEAAVSVSEVKSLGCLRICVQIPGVGMVCYHQPVA